MTTASPGPSPGTEVHSLLTAAGELRSGASTTLTPDQLHEAHRWMWTSRLVDELLVSVQRQGRSNVHAPARGQEAAVVGSALAVDADLDWIVPQYREVAAVLRHGLPLRALWLHKLGTTRLGAVPPSVKVLPMQISIGAQIPQGVGIAWGLQRQREGGVALVYFGDGASSEGDFHEGANFAGVLSAPAVLFCQNNGWAISAPISRQTAATAIADRGIGYGMPGVRVDGNDLLAVHQVTAEAVTRARAGEGPTLIEAVTYRLGMHNTADDPRRYMDDEELGVWSGRDPVVRFEAYLDSAGLFDADRTEAMKVSIRAELEETWRAAEAEALATDPVEAMFDHVYAAPPARQEAQRAEAGRWARA